MTIKDLKVERKTFNTPAREFIGFSCEVIISRGGETYSVPYNKRFEIDAKEYDEDSFEVCLYSVLEDCKRINEKWQLVIEEEHPYAPVGHTKGRVISQRPFDITRDL